MKRPETISAEELERRMTQPGVVVVDLRSAAEYRKMHIPGAVHVPYENLGRLSRYRDQWIILYCEHGITSMAVYRHIWQKEAAQFLTGRTGCGYNSLTLAKEKQKNYEESTV